MGSYIHGTIYFISQIRINAHLNHGTTFPTKGSRDIPTYVPSAIITSTKANISQITTFHRWSDSHDDIQTFVSWNNHITYGWGVSNIWGTIQISMNMSRDMACIHWSQSHVGSPTTFPCSHELSNKYFDHAAWNPGRHIFWSPWESSAEVCTSMWNVTGIVCVILVAHQHRISGHYCVPTKFSCAENLQAHSPVVSWIVKLSWFSRLCLVLRLHLICSCGCISWGCSTGCYLVCWCIPISNSSHHNSMHT